MSDLGALLRKAREQRGFSLDDIQEHTKIRKRYLEAIESGDYKVLPGSFYVRAFVKTYAETVGLDAEEVLRLYQKELPKTPSEEDSIVVEARMKPRRRSVQHNDRWGKLAVTLLMWAFPLLIAAIIYIYISNNKDTKGPDELQSNPPITSETATPPPTMTPTVTPTPEPTPDIAPTVLTLTRTSGGIQYYDVVPGTEHKLTIELTGRSWLEVIVGTRSGERLYYANADAGTYTYDLDKALFINVGRADYATIMIDDQLVPDHDAANKVQFIFTPISDEQQQ